MAETPPELSFRDVLSAALEASGTGQEELARRIGRSGAAVSQWLRKGDMPDLAVIFKIEDALELRLGTLVRHASPDVWVIIETKTMSGNTWKALDWEKKFKEALIDAPLDNTERTLIRQTVQRFVAYHVTRGSERGPGQ